MKAGMRGAWLLLIAMACLALLLTSGCSSTRGGAAGPSSPGVSTPVATPGQVPVTPPQPAAPAAEPIVGTWYVPAPDDLTFEFRGDGTFTERSPNFPAYQGTWTKSEEDFYDAFILDRWGYRKPAHFLYASGTLMTKGIGDLHRV